MSENQNNNISKNQDNISKNQDNMSENQDNISENKDKETNDKKIDEKEREKIAKELIHDFLKEHGNAIVETAIQYTKENGLGALFITITPNSPELDIEYFKVDDLDGGFKNKINNNPNNQNYVYYAIKLHNHSYIFERDLGEKVEEYIV